MIYTFCGIANVITRSTKLVVKSPRYRVYLFMSIHFMQIFAMCVGFVGVLDAIAAVDEITLNRNFHFVMHNVIFKSDNTYDTEYIYRTCLIDSTCIQFCGIDVCLANCSFHVEYRLQLAWYFAIAMSYNVRRDAHMHLYCI